MSYLSWRTVYFVSIGLRFVLALSNSYIHPDEHFQGFEVLAGRLCQISTKEPWEFASAAPARSFAPLFLIYYVPLKISQFLGLSPLQTWYLVRLVFMALSWVVTDWCLYRMLPTKQERVKAIYFVSTSYVSLVYQSHTFSNSVETVLVVLAVYWINELRFIRTIPRAQYTASGIVYISGMLGVVCACGVFNRVTFPAFLVLPSVFLLQCAWKWPYLVAVSGTTFVLTCTGCILVDTVIFTQKKLFSLLQNPWQWSQYVVTPYNNLAYNAKVENLAVHGLHPFYTHVMVNLPQILGPGLLFLLPRFRNNYWKTTPFLAASSGILFLSLVPHQELRFLIPVVPLFCACFDVAGLESAFKKHGQILGYVMNAWLVFNAVMATIMGVFHQGGVVPALDYLHENRENISPDVAFVWWRTYSPPTWMLDERKGDLQIISLNEDHTENLDSISGKVSVDAMGMEVSRLHKVIETLSATHDSVYLIAPIASFKQNFNPAVFDEIWSYHYHLDMDHLDFARPQSLHPGIAIYSLL